MSESITNLSDAVAAVGALSVPVGPERRTLDKVEDELTGANLSLYEEELTSARLRLALASAQRGRRELRRLVESMCAELNGHECPPPGESPLEMVTRFVLRLMEAERQLAALLTERHSTNEALDDAVQELRAREGRSADRLTALLAPSQALREEQYESLHHDYRVGRDLPEAGAR